MFYILSFLTFLTIFVADANGRVNPNWRCPSNELQHFRDFTHCSKYVTCYEGKVFSQECMRGLHFDVERSVCDFPENVNCTACPPDGITTVQTGCSRYNLCVYGQPVEKTCPPGTFFNLYECEAGEECPFVPCLEAPMGLLFDRAPNCTSYHICLDGRNVGIRHCPGNTWFDKATDSCRSGIQPPECRVDPIFDISQIFPQNGNRDPYTCPSRGIETIGIRRDCSKYAICIDGEIFEFTCPDGSLYSIQSRMCTHPHLVDC